MNDKTANFFSLFASSSTLICCALPAVFVLLGAGASFASLLSVFPFLIILSQYKLAITAAAFAMIVVAGYVNYKTYYMPCPIDPEASLRVNRTWHVVGFVIHITSNDNHSECCGCDCQFILGENNQERKNA